MKAALRGIKRFMDLDAKFPSDDLGLKNSRRQDHVSLFCGGGGLGGPAARGVEGGGGVGYFVGLGVWGCGGCLAGGVAGF